MDSLRQFRRLSRTSLIASVEESIGLSALLTNVSLEIVSARVAEKTTPLVFSSFWATFLYYVLQ
jgi:hypothetical protein